MASRHLVAASLLYRKLADAVLAKAQSAYYEHAVRDLAPAGHLAAGVTDWLSQPAHDDYRREVAARYRQKSAFLKLAALPSPARSDVAAPARHLDPARDRFRAQPCRGIG